MAAKIQTAKELLEKNVEEMPMLLEGVYPQSGLVALAGGSDTGKSSLLRQLAFAICSGHDKFLGIKLNLRHHSCVYVTTEDDENAMAFLLNKQAKRVHDLLSTSRFFVFTEVDSSQLGKELDEHLTSNPADIVFIDVISDLITGDMNSQTLVRQVLNVFSRISSKHDCLIVLLHHLKKSAQGQPTKNQLNGSQAFEAKMRAVLILSKKEDYSSEERYLQLVKGNYSSSETKKKVQVLEFNESTLTFNLLRHESVTEGQSPKYNEETIEFIFELHNKGLGVRKIESELEEIGVYIGKSTIARIIQKNAES